MDRSNQLYPIKFTPILKEKVWGGTKLMDLFNKQSEGSIGESWEISGVDNSISLIQNGFLKGKNLTELIEEFKEKLVGDKVYNKFKNIFPLLFKFIDARENLSVQLHPNDKLAKERHNSFGKTEMWYIIDAEKEGSLILGFDKEMNESIYKEHLKKHSLSEILNKISVKKGDAFFIETGTVHTIGAGVVLAEIQQTSDITYRIYDYNRPDTDGNLRELHTDLALDAIDFNASNARLNYSNTENSANLLCENQFFKVNILILNTDIERDLSTIDSFIVYMCMEGKGIIEINNHSETIGAGETILIPAISEAIKIKSKKATFLEVYIP